MSGIAAFQPIALGGRLKAVSGLRQAGTKVGNRPIAVKHTFNQVKSAKRELPFIQNKHSPKTS